MGKLTKPARIGSTVFEAGVDEELVIRRAQREYEYQERKRAGAPPLVGTPADWIQEFRARG